MADKPAQKVEVSLRDYFIAHASSKPHSWFKPVIKEPRPESIYIGIDGKRYERQSLARNACGEDGFENINEKVQIAWDEEYRKQFCIQWPRAWADFMLAERERE